MILAHVLILSCIFLFIFSKLASKSTPNNVNLSLHCKFSSLQIIFFSILLFSFVPTVQAIVLLVCISNPLMYLKSLRTSITFLRFISSCSRNNVMSSAKRLISAVILLIVIPFIPSVFFNLIASISIHSVNKAVEIGSPCLLPLCNLKFSDKCPPLLQQTIKSDNKMFTHFIIFSPKLYIFNVLSMNLCEIVSNAFLKSISNIILFIFLLFT